MPRPERPLGSDSAPLTQFAADLRTLRDQVGRPTYRALAIRARYSATTLSEAAGGRTLPTLAVTLAYVRACGGDATEWERRWHLLAAILATPDTDTLRHSTDTTGDGDQTCAPYVGLAAFEPEDAERFFGRDVLVEELVDRVAKQRFVAVFGASGVGKSSVLRAGLIARTRTLHGREATPIVLFTPGPHPIQECAVALTGATGRPVTELHADLLAAQNALHLQVRAAMADKPGGVDLLLVIDQFEEVFTLCQDPAERAQFIALLLHAVNESASRVRVVLGVRTDFYTHCTRVPDLLAALRDHQVPVGPMSTEELRSAITQPATRVGATVEAALLAAIMADSAGEPGVLPLLSHALLETWRRRRGTTLTLAGYQAVGGITHAIAWTAERTYDQFNGTQRRLTKGLFLRLTALGESTQDTKRRIHRDEVDTTDPNMATILEQLTRARLITLDDDHVEIAHEALINCWPRLRDWLSDDRDGLRVHRQLTEAAQAWEVADRDGDALYRGSRLSTARDWADAGDTVLSPREREFLTASLTAQTHAQALSRRRTRRLRQLVALLSVLLVVASAVTVYAAYAERSAIQQRDLAVAQNAFSQATALHGANPALAEQLTLAAYRLDPSQPIRSALLNDLNTPSVRQLTRLGALEAPMSSADGTTLAAASPTDHAVHVWNIADPHHPTMVATIPTTPSSVPIAVSHDGRYLLTMIDPHPPRLGRQDARLWNLTQPRHPVVLATITMPEGAVSGTFSSDGRLLMTGNQLWDLTNPRQPVALATLPTVASANAALSPDGRLAAVAIDSEHSLQVDLFDISSPLRPVGAGKITADTDTAVSVVFDPVGATLAIGTESGAVHLWNVTDPRQPTLITTLTSASAIRSLAFSPDGHTLAGDTADGSAVVWNVAAPTASREVALVASDDGRGFSGPLVFGVDGHSLIVVGGRESTIGPNAATELIELPGLTLGNGTENATSVAISPDGQTLATSDTKVNERNSQEFGESTAQDTQLWDLRDPTQPHATLTLSSAIPAGAGTAQTPLEAVGGTVLFSPRGDVLASSSTEILFGVPVIGLWGMSDPRHPLLLATLSGQSIHPDAFSPDGRMLAASNTLAATATTSGLAVTSLWDVADPRHPRILGRIDGHGFVEAFSPDGRLAEMTSSSGVLTLWDMTRPDRPRPVSEITRLSPEYLNAPLNGSAAFQPDGHILAISKFDGTVELWNVADAARPIKVAVLSTGAPVERTTVDNSMKPVVFSPDGQTLATAGAGQTTLVWDVHDPAHPTEVAVLASAVYPGAFGPDGHTLIVIDTNGNVELRETDLRRAAVSICTLTGATLTPEVWGQYFPGLPYQPPCP